MTLNSKNNHANEISVHKLVKNEVLHEIVGIFCQKLKIKMVDGSHEFMQISISRREKVYHVIAV